MENKVVGFLPKLLFKIFLRLKEKFDPTPPVPEEEKITIQICKKLLDDTTSKLTYAPLAHKRFIKNEQKDMYIVIHEHTINLINHVYSYSIYLTDTNSYREITEKFDSVLDIERLKLEDEIKNNIQHSLASILNKLG
jgi:hypothetical protein